MPTQQQQKCQAGRRTSIARALAISHRSSHSQLSLPGPGSAVHACRYVRFPAGLLHTARARRVIHDSLGAHLQQQTSQTSITASATSCQPLLRAATSCIACLAICRIHTLSGLYTQTRVCFHMNDQRLINPVYVVLYLHAQVIAAGVADSQPLSRQRSGNGRPGSRNTTMDSDDDSDSDIASIRVRAGRLSPLGWVEVCLGCEQWTVIHTYL